MRILITEKIAAESVAFLRQQGFEVDEKLGYQQSEIEALTEPYDAIIVRSVTRVNRSLLEQAANLKVVGRAGNGIDNIDVPACTERGVIVVNTPEANIMAAGELAVGLSFAAFRNICQANAAAHADDFRRGMMIGSELEGKTAGIIGLGRIGSIVARKLKGVGMRVIAYDPYIPQERFDKLGVTRCEELQLLLEQSDLITLHTPKTKETYGMIGRKELSWCKPGVRIVNAARGGLVDEQALLEALRSGHVAAAAIDVFDVEPSYDKTPGEQQYVNPLLNEPNCIVTPHLGASTYEANDNVGTTVTELVARALNGELVAAVNMPVIHGSVAEMRPYLNLCEKLGSIYYQAEREPVQRIEVLYSGELALRETGLLTLSVLKGFLSTITEDRISYVNILQRMSGMGIDVIEGKQATQDKLPGMVTVRFHTSDRVLDVSGTVLGRDTEVLVDFFGYRLNFEFTPHILAMQNHDVPGIIGAVGTTLGARQINISSMQWSRKKDKKRAQSFLSIDSPADQQTLDQLRAIPGVLRVSALHFTGAET